MQEVRRSRTKKHLEPLQPCKGLVRIAVVPVCSALPISHAGHLPYTAIYFLHACH